MRRRSSASSPTYAESYAPGPGHAAELRARYERYRAEADKLVNPRADGGLQRALVAADASIGALEMDPTSLACATRAERALSYLNTRIRIAYEDEHAANLRGPNLRVGR